MPRYNHNRTAYYSYVTSAWYLIPDGKKRAPLLGKDGPRLTSRYDRHVVSDEHINLITNRDRIILLEAVAGGCYDQVWGRMKELLKERSRKNYKILMDYTGLKE